MLLRAFSNSLLAATPSRCIAPALPYTRRSRTSSRAERFESGVAAAASAYILFLKHIALLYTEWYDACIPATLFVKNRLVARTSGPLRRCRGMCARRVRRSARAFPAAAARAACTRSQRANRGGESGAHPREQRGKEEFCDR